MIGYFVLILVFLPILLEDILDVLQNVLDLINAFNKIFSTKRPIYIRTPDMPI
jgi:hypothetical protein